MSAVSPLLDRPLDSSPQAAISSADDVDSATAALSDAYSDVTVAVPSPTDHLRLRLQTVSLPSLNMGDLTISRATVRSPRYPWYAVCLPMSGHIRISQSGASATVGAGLGAVVSPGKPVSVEYLSGDCRMETLLLDRADVEDELSAILGRAVLSPVQFDLQLSQDDVAPFQRALDIAHDELERPRGLTTVPIMSARLGRLVIAGLLIGQPSNYSGQISAPRGVEGPRAIRTAVGLIEERPMEIVTAGDIAHAVGLSVRALDEGFRRHVGSSPMAYLREVRMARAHQELVASDPDATTATLIAYTWGFGNYGRFAVAYRRRYGCTPSETLRRRITAERP
jgi:AraC-like DNA-binding protein